MTTRKAHVDDIEELLRAKMKQLEDERDEILVVAAPLIKKRDKLIAQIQPLENELREVNRQIKAIEAPHRERLIEVAHKIGVIADSISGKGRLTNTGEAQRA